MRTFKCDGCYEKCCVTIQFGANTPRHCHHDDNRSNWHEVKGKVKLKKLTVDVFNRPDCPQWAKYAAVDKNGIAGYFSEHPSNRVTPYQWMVQEPAEYQKIDDRFDSSDWKNSLIKRPAKATLPDWCKVGKWGYDTSKEEYFEIVAVTPFNVEAAYLDDEFTMVIGINIFNDDCVQANKRPFNKEEMQKLVGKVLDWEGNRELVISYDVDTAEIYVDHMWCSAKYLKDNEYTIDGKPCYVLEYLNEEKKWVK